MIDPVFGELEYDDDCACWCGSLTIDFFGTDPGIKLMIQTSCEEVEDVRESQCAAYQQFMAHWPALQKPMAEAIIQGIGVAFHNEELHEIGFQDIAF